MVVLYSQSLDQGGQVLERRKTNLINGISHLSQIYRSSWSMGNNVDNNYYCHSHKLIMHIQKTACGGKKKTRAYPELCIYTRAKPTPLITRMRRAEAYSYVIDKNYYSTAFILITG